MTQKNRDIISAAAIVLSLLIILVLLTGCGDEGLNDPLTNDIGTVAELKQENVPNAPSNPYHRRITIEQIIAEFQNPRQNTVTVKKFHALKGRIGTFSEIRRIGQSVCIWENVACDEWIQIASPVSWLKLYIFFDNANDYTTFTDVWNDTYNDVRFKIVKTIEIGTPQNWKGEMHLDYYPTGQAQSQGTQTYQTQSHNTPDPNEPEDIQPGSIIKTVP